MKYKFEARSYRRVFKKALITSQCILREREGVIVRLENDAGAVGFGEIAPFEFLGTESFDDVKRFCKKVGPEVSEDLIESIDKGLICCQFGMRSAEKMLRGLRVGERAFEVAGLVSLMGKDVNENRKTDCSDYRIFKCKIGAKSFVEEKEAFLRFYAKLPLGVELRLDANGAFTLNEARQWLSFLEGYKIQFIEQPLSKGQELLMAELSRDYGTKIALDESVIGGDDFKKICDSEWPGWVVIKPCLVGDFESFFRLRELSNIPIVYSSVFETAVGMEAALGFAASDIRNDHVLGFGTMDYFVDDGFGFHQKGSRIDLGEMVIDDFERIWALCEKLK